MATIQSAKATLRKEIEKKLSTLTLEEKKKQSQQVLKKLFDLPVFQESQRISIYLSTDNEISTEPIIKNIFENGKACYVPRYNKAVMEMVKLHSMQDWETLPLTKWNIKQPSLSEDRENALNSGGLDLIIVPGVAFTANGVRLGHGKGYYDSFLHLVQQSQSNYPTTVALAFKEQIVEEVPKHDHDVIIDHIMYPN